MTIQKKCNLCCKYKDFSYFYKSKGGLYGLHTYCKDCLKEYRKSRSGKECIDCGEVKLVDKNTTYGPLCSNCNSKRNKKICFNCGELREVDTNKNGIILCNKCARKERKEICYLCKNLRAIEAVIEGNPICGSCQKKNRKRICFNCKCLKPIHGNNLCYSCYKKYKMENDYKFRIKELVRNRIREVVRGKTSKNVKILKIIEFLGPCPGELKDYHIDHVFPLSAFNLDDEQEFQMAFSPQNHQWLLASENLSKQNKYNVDEFYIFKMSFK